jgi:hypothetical protein
MGADMNARSNYYTPAVGVGVIWLTPDFESGASAISLTLGWCWIGVDFRGFAEVYDSPSAWFAL